MGNLHFKKKLTTESSILESSTRDDFSQKDGSRRASRRLQRRRFQPRCARNVVSKVESFNELPLHAQPTPQYDTSESSGLAVQKSSLTGSKSTDELDQAPNHDQRKIPARSNTL